jgi:hypothetical protein
MRFFFCFCFDIVCFICKLKEQLQHFFIVPSLTLENFGALHFFFLSFQFYHHLVYVHEVFSFTSFTTSWHPLRQCIFQVWNCFKLCSLIFLLFFTRSSIFVFIFFLNSSILNFFLLFFFHYIFFFWQVSSIALWWCFLDNHLEFIIFYNFYPFSILKKPITLSYFVFNL